MKGKVGIIVSPGFGAGWSTWGEDEGMALDQELAIAIYTKMSFVNLEKIAKKNWPDAYLGGLEDCYVEWVDKGTRFDITEYDGSETLILEEEYEWQVAE